MKINSRFSQICRFTNKISKIVIYENTCLVFLTFPIFYTKFHHVFFIMKIYKFVNCKTISWKCWFENRLVSLKWRNSDFEWWKIVSRNRNPVWPKLVTTKRCFLTGSKLLYQIWPIKLFFKQRVSYQFKE